MPTICPSSPASCSFLVVHNVTAAPARRAKNREAAHLSRPPALPLERRRESGPSPRFIQRPACEAARPYISPSSTPRGRPHGGDPGPAPPFSGERLGRVPLSDVPLAAALSRPCGFASLRGAGRAHPGCPAGSGCRPGWLCVDGPVRDETRPLLPNLPGSAGGARPRLCSRLPSSPGPLDGCAPSPLPKERRLRSRTESSATAAALPEAGGMCAETPAAWAVSGSGRELFTAGAPEAFFWLCVWIVTGTQPRPGHGDSLQASPRTTSVTPG